MGTKLEDNIDFHIFTYTSSMVGLYHVNKDGNIRYQILYDYLNDVLDDDKRYDGYKESDILSEDYYNPERLYEYSYKEVNTVQLEMEPDNQFDQHPIKVVHKEMGDLGYLPVIHKDNVADIIVNHNLVTVEMVVKGGKYIDIDLNTRQIERGEDPLQVMLTLFYE